MNGCCENSVNRHLEARLILAIDTATQSIGIALHDGQRLLAECTWQSGRHHTVELAPEIALLMRRVKRSPDDLTAVAVASGPGSYTGLRIGMALAKGLALVHHIPLIGISTFDILAKAQPPGPDRLYAVLKAGRKRLSVCAYEPDNAGWVQDGEPQNTTWEELIDSIDTPVLLCGEMDEDARLLLDDRDNILVAAPPDSLRRPAWLAELAWKQIHSGKITDPAAVAPWYLDPRGESAL